MRMIRDDGKSTRTDPDPQVFLKGFRGVKGPNNTASHFHETEAGVLIITAFRINMAEIVRKFNGVGTGKLPGGSFMFSSIIMFQHPELIIIRYS